MKPFLAWLAGLLLASVPGSGHAADAPRGATVPFTTYEAETPARPSRGKVVRLTGLPGRTDASPELEASGRGYVELAQTGDFLEFSDLPRANTIVVRHCIPDAPEGGGWTATLILYVNGQRRQALSLSSKYNWLYGKAGENGQSNDPKAGTPHVFWDETRFFLQGDGVKPGDVLRLQKDAGDTAAYYRIDLIELEQAPAPLPPPAEAFLSAVDFGANGGDEADDTKAIQACIEAARTQKKIVWLPAGTYYQSALFVLDGVQVRGAGMWHTNLIGTTSGGGFSGTVGFRLLGEGPAVSDLFIESRAHTNRPTPGGKAFTAAFDNCRNWRVENVWITHTHVGFWMSGVRNGVVRGCRVRFTYADGININRGSRDNRIEQNHVRGLGDDGVVVLALIDRTPTPSVNCTMRFNTVVANWWGHNLSIGGGSGHVVEDNLLADNARIACLSINLPSAYPKYPMIGATIRRNTIVRGGGNFANQRRGAVWISAGSTTIRDVVIADNEILSPLFRGIHLTGSRQQDLVVERNVIDSPGQDAIAIDSTVQGSGVFRENTVRGLKAGFQPFVNNGGADYKETLSGNSW